VQVPTPFEYERATSVEHALQLLTELGPDARILAGGYSLLPMMKLRLARPEWLIDIDDLVPELGYIRADDSQLQIGAMTRHRELLESALIADRSPIFVDAERVIADPVVRNRGTIGGALCQADPSEDLSAVCTALDAEIVIRSLDGVRIVDMGEFYRGPYQTAVEADEIVIEIRIPLRRHSGSAYEQVNRRVGDWAVAAAATSVTLTDGAISDAGGMAAALPHCDALVSGHSLEALQEVIAAIASCRADDAGTAVSWKPPALVVEPGDQPWRSATPVKGGSVAMPTGYSPKRGKTSPGWTLH
jgi:carbon-monoxide dehydrogenase medium subunit